MRTVILRDKEWLRGRGSEVSGLWKQKLGLGCCIGHAVSQLAPCDIHELRSYGSYIPVGPQGYGVPPVEELTAARNCGDIAEVYYINDAQELSDLERVALLNDVMNPHGIRFEFQEGENKS